MLSAHRGRIESHLGGRQRVRGRPSASQGAATRARAAVDRRWGGFVVLVRRENEITRLTVWVASVVSLENTRCPVRRPH